MVRLIGAVLIFFSVSSFGIYLSDNIKRKRERLETERKIIDEIALMIRWNSLTLHEIAEELYDNKSFSDFELIKNLADNCNHTRSFHNAWEKSVSSVKNLCAEEKKLLFEVGAALGTTDKEGQLSTLELFSTRIEKMAESEAEKYKIKGKMYRSLGVTAGAMIGIIII